MSSKLKLIVIAAIIGLIIINVYTTTEQNNGSSIAVVSKDNEKSSGKAAIGGDFELTDQNGQPFSSDKLNGKISMIYFGFTNCPMICPTALNTMSIVMNELGDKASKFQPVFITTDPERDTTEKLKDYLASFHPSFIGLTGTKEQLAKAYEGYKVYAKKVDTGTENYDMNHSSIIYVMNENGEYVKHFTHQSDPKDILSKISGL
jgi:protein SCO1/2